MAEIVAAAAAVHAPQLISRPQNEELAKLDRGTDALHRLGRVLDETAPDVLLVIGLDHLETFWLGAAPTFTVFVGEHAEADYAGRVHRKVPVHTDLAVDLLKGLVARDFDMTFSQEGTLGHAFLTPFQYVLQDRPIPVVPLLVNVYLPPLPSPRRCYALGRAIADVLASRPERVAVLASGGMSHFPGTARYHDPQLSFDEWVLQEVGAGRWQELLDLTPVQLDEVGEGELLTWFVMLGITGELPASMLSYQALSHHGHGVVQLVPPVAATAPPPEPTVPRYGGHVFTQTDYRWYRFPEPSSFALNRLLHQIIVNPAFRSEFVRNRAAVVGAAELTDPERRALLAEGFDELVLVGAHPLLALSARQVVALELQKDAPTGTAPPTATVEAAPPSFPTST
ncbi:hypothetical protein GCM10022225_26120 [Plantactinospora mayteni]|uniref:Extradiol ring-cleavage dioxygenase class III enzyme subunit B domain-containing protein n=1 Tax=Plantactinospora mayteni TaxID=566021 RepID=A0ABQ4EIU0_9ACTN|nr:hypothetical protein [Plantactinospora mayteni]GIG94658.1 hypothetical protein Pma05_12310 [Plantactinospora mayteni]